jgi:hypothetical protein
VVKNSAGAASGSSPQTDNGFTVIAVEKSYSNTFVRGKPMLTMTPQEKAQALVKECLALQFELPRGLQRNALEAAAHLTAIEGYLNLHQTTGNPSLR